MGTNYYAYSELCKECKQRLPEATEMTKVHIGKSSIGWEFSFNHNNWEYYKTIPELRLWMGDKLIKNEYGETVDYIDFWELVDSKKGGLTSKDDIIKDGYRFSPYVDFS